MSKATTNYTDLSYVAEVTPGVIPDNPVFQLLPTTGGALALTITTEVSEVIRSDRQIDDLVPVDAEVTGDINFELSYTPWKPLIIELLRTPDAANPYKNGFEAPGTFTFCKRIIVGNVTNYFYYTGCVIGSMTLNFATGTRLTGMLNIMGREETATTTPLAGQSFTDVAEYAIMNSVSNLMIAITDLPAETCFQKLDLTIANNSTGAKCIGIFGASDIQDFALDVTGAIETYFEDLVLYNKFLDSQAFSVTITLTDSLMNEIEIVLPKCKFEELSVPIPGKNQFLSMPGSIRALREPVGNYTVSVAFTDGAAPSV